LFKTPIQVRPADANACLARASRVRFGKVYSIEWNIKVKDVGLVIDEDLEVLVHNYQAEQEKYQ
jgi:hypothetical protein